MDTSTGDISITKSQDPQRTSLCYIVKMLKPQDNTKNIKSYKRKLSAYIQSESH